LSVLPAESAPEQQDGREEEPGGPAGSSAAHHADNAGRAPQLDHSIAPRKPRTVGGAVFLGVLATTLLGVLVVMAGRVQAGLSTAGAGLLLGALARLVLPQQQAGMLGVRRKLIDVSTMVLLGGGLVVLAAVIRERVP
jgi:Protein of unknown function (DUF3017)